jgi:hypothetical protein
VGEGQEVGQQEENGKRREDPELFQASPNYGYMVKSPYAAQKNYTPTSSR